jgi:hypothetical protein
MRLIFSHNVPRQVFVLAWATVASTVLIPDTSAAVFAARRERWPARPA